MNKVAKHNRDSRYPRLGVMQPRIRDTRISMARDLERPTGPETEPTPGQPAELTLRDGDHEKHVYVKVWDGQRVFWWQGMNWRVVHVKKSVWEVAFNSPLWWSFYGER